jgi:hypothetical protein
MVTLDYQRLLKHYSCLAVPLGPLIVRFKSRNFTPVELSIGPDAKTENLKIKVELLIPAVHESVVI